MPDPADTDYLEAMYEGGTQLELTCPQCHGFGFVHSPHREKIDGYLEDVHRSCGSCAGHGTIPP